MTDDRSTDRARARESRREAARARERAESRNKWLLPVAGIALLVLAAGGAFLLANSQGGGGSSDLPSDLPTGSVPAADAPTITGAALAPLQSGAADAAVGATIPEVRSATADILVNGRPKVLLFLAHWCPHCQNEVPVIQDWLDAGGLPADVDLVSVSTSIDPNRPNYPPEAWLDREGWTAPTIVDPQNTVAEAFGLTAFPFFVFVNADGTVSGRLTGELGISDLETIIASLER